MHHPCTLVSMYGHTPRCCVAALHRYPKARVSLTSSRLHLHLSPARYHRLMMCVAALSQPSPGSSSAAGLSAAAAAAAHTQSQTQSYRGAPGSPLPAWLTDAEHQQQDVWVRETATASTAAAASGGSGAADAGAAGGGAGGAGKKAHWSGPRVVRVWRGRLYVTPDACTSQPSNTM